MRIWILAALIPSGLLAADEPQVLNSTTSVSDQFVIHMPVRQEQGCYHLFAREILEDGKHYGYDIQYGKKFDCATIGEQETVPEWVNKDSK
jgi:hypothetical protein